MVVALGEGTRSYDRECVCLPPMVSVASVLQHVAVVISGTVAFDKSRSINQSISDARKLRCSSRC